MYLAKWYNVQRNYDKNIPFVKDFFHGIIEIGVKNLGSIQIFKLTSFAFSYFSYFIAIPQI